MQKNISPLIFFLTVIAGVGIDAVSKILTQLYLAGNSIILIPGFLSLEYVRNPGIAFSLPLMGNPLKIITMILIFAIILYYIYEERPKKHPLIDIGFALILSGALGNAWERWFIHSVTDMIAVERFAVFNIADSFIFLGACILVYITFFTKKSNI